MDLDQLSDDSLSKRKFRKPKFAIKSSQSKLAETLTFTNPLCDKQLEGQLKEIDDKKRMREIHHFLEQRQFFIRALFDGEDQLRFAKTSGERGAPEVTQQDAMEERMYAAYIAQARGKCQASATSRTTNNLTPRSPRRPIADIVKQNNKTPTTMTERLFMEQSSTPKGINHARIHHAEQRLQSTRQQLSQSSKRWTSAPAQRTTKPVVIPERAPTSLSNAEVQMHNSPRSAFICTPAATKNVTVRATARSEKKMKVGKLTVANLKSHTTLGKQIGDFAAELLQRFLRDTKDMCKARNVELYGSSPFERRLQGERQPSETQLRKRQENLVRKLAMSLPVHMMAKTEEKTASFPEVMGYNERKQALLKQEKVQSVALKADTDRRFHTLVGTLAQS